MKKKKRISNKAVVFFTIIFLIFASISYFSQTGILNLPTPVAKIFQLVFLVSTTMFITSLWVRITAPRVFNAFKDDLDVEQRLMLSNIYAIFWYAIGIAIILYILGVQSSDITLFLGLVTTGLAFAIRDIILAFFAWLIILNKRPFEHGDVINMLDGVNREQGKVHRIGIFFVTLDMKGKLTRVPNKLFLEKMINVSQDGIVHNEIRFPLTKTTKNLAKWKKETIKTIGTFEQTSITVNLDSDGKDSFIVVSYECPHAEEQELRAHITSKLFEKKKESKK